MNTGKIYTSDTFIFDISKIGLNYISLKYLSKIQIKEQGITSLVFLPEVKKMAATR